MADRVRVQGDLFHGIVPDGAVYIGRAAPGLPRSPYANPFTVRRHGLTESLKRYAAYLAERSQLVELARRQIGDQPMACWCREGDPCHGDVLRAAMRGER